MVCDYSRRHSTGCKVICPNCPATRNQCPAFAWRLRTEYGFEDTIRPTGPRQFRLAVHQFDPSFASARYPSSPPSESTFNCQRHTVVAPTTNRLRQVWFYLPHLRRILGLEILFDVSSLQSHCFHLTKNDAVTIRRYTYRRSCVALRAHFATRVFTIRNLCSVTFPGTPRNKISLACHALSVTLET